jgi:hypothetical protein
VAWFGSYESHFVNLPGNDSRQTGTAHNGGRGSPSPPSETSVSITGYTYFNVVLRIDALWLEKQHLKKL